MGIKLPFINITFLLTNYFDKLFNPNYESRFQTSSTFIYPIILEGNKVMICVFKEVMYILDHNVQIIPYTFEYLYVNYLYDNHQ